jgi:hypothetical protein
VRKNEEKRKEKRKKRKKKKKMRERNPRASNMDRAYGALRRVGREGPGLTLDRNLDHRFERVRAPKR